MRQTNEPNVRLYLAKRKKKKYKERLIVINTIQRSASRKNGSTIIKKIVIRTYNLKDAHEIDSSVLYPW